MTDIRRSLAVVLAAGLFGGIALPATQAAEGEPATPGVYSGVALARGVQVNLETSPPLNSVDNLYNLQLPYATSALDSTGQASATGSSLSAGNLTEIPGLLCLARFPCPPGFPPPYPFSASAAHPARPDDKATASGQPVAVPGVLTSTPSDVRAHADPTLVDSTASSNRSAAFPGTPTALSNGSSTSMTRQAVENGVFVTRAEALVNDIDLGGVVRIDSVRAVSEIRNDGKAISETTTVTASGVTALGQPAVIDENGIRLAQQGDGGLLGGATNAALAQALAASGVSARLVGVSKTVEPGRGATTAAGLLVSFQREATGLPKPPSLPCPPEPFPAVLCLGTPDPNRVYTGTVLYASAGTVNAAGDDLSFDPLADVFDLPPDAAGIGGSADTSGLSGTPGTPGIPGTEAVPATDLPLGGSTTLGGSSSALEAPQAAGDATIAAGRVRGGGLDLGSSLWWFFPLLMVGGLFVAAARLVPLPSRLPRTL